MEKLHLSEQVLSDGYFTSVGEITPRLAHDTFLVVQKECKKLEKVVGKDAVLVIMSALLKHFTPTSNEPVEVEQYVQKELF